MFGEKKDLRVVELTPAQKKLAQAALFQFRNKLAAQGKPTEDVAELILKIVK